ncbi:MAG: carboxypeptidase-like regulatory domain-containing protein [Urechidicola sp.]|nr:carboxypeptidase-like regulatory domain-containing protein [Urechidicola sp.]
MKKLAYVLLFIGLSSYSQTSIEGYIYDKTTDETLPYATLRLLNTNYYTITNQDGKFNFHFDKDVQVDSLEVRFYGFKTAIVPISFFDKNKKLSLIPSVSNLDEVHLITDKKKIKANQQRTYNLFYSLIKKYRRKKRETESKLFLSLSSSARNTPIEQIEGFYNSKQSLASGITNLRLKSGRFGQNRSFPFYSINNTTILNNFNLFNETHQILPFYPGNMNLSGIKNKYNLEIEFCSECESTDIKILFTPKKQQQKYFSGYIIFDKEKLIVKKIDLQISNPIASQLSSIVENDIISLKELALEINFNPLDFELIQSYNFKFVMDYTSTMSSETITSNSFLYFYDYDHSFELPHFTNPIEFRNDYDQIIAQQSSIEFWESNYQYPKSFDENKSMAFMEQYGYLINYTNDIPSDYVNYINPSVVAWSANKRLTWESIKSKTVTTRDDKTSFEKQSNSHSTNYVDKQSHSISGLTKSKVKKVDIEKISFSYVLDFNKNEVGENQYTSRTIFNRATSFYNGTESSNKLIYFNLVFDIYEFYRQNIEIATDENTSFKKIKLSFDSEFNEATKLIEQMQNETSSGENFQQLILWNNKIKTFTNIDNYKIISIYD